MTQRVLCVLGMHRSGTSCLAGCLQAAGVYLGDVFTDNPYNKKGNREHATIMALHEDLLASNAGSWSAPPPRVIWHARHERIRSGVIEDFSGKVLWGFKDPRTLLTVEGWLDAIPHMEFVASFRHPFSVAKSLNKRNRGELSSWLELWYEYNSRLVALHTKISFPVLEFGVPDVDYLVGMKRVLRRLGLREEGAHFFDAQLRHQDGKLGQEIPSQYTDLYQQLVRLARDG